jgi:demethylmenaquinone methyltransferase/2-methoxy-6-polyprenyl-1,4-benzoquinol methylase
MFSAIASTYDLLNHLLSLNIDRHWRAVTVRSMAPGPDDLLLDVCTGTGDLAIALCSESDTKVVGLDFSEGMLAVAREKIGRRRRSIPLVQGDALALPFRADTFSGATVAFGVRNFEDLDTGLREVARVLRPRGRLAVLEFSSPDRSILGSLFRFYFRRVLPLIGRMISGSSGAYSYLPETVEGFPDARAFGARLRAAGLEVVGQRGLTGGIATLHIARKLEGQKPAEPSGKMVP